MSMKALLILLTAAFSFLEDVCRSVTVMNTFFSLVPDLGPLSALSVASPGRDSGGSVPRPTNAATAGAGASQCLSEQDQNADRCPA